MYYTLWWKMLPLPQNTSAVVGNLKEISSSIALKFLSEIGNLLPIDPVQKHLNCDLIDFFTSDGRLD